jgi:adenine-specific DNA-methyltransferase
MIYIDPPYGINYRSNFQPSIGKRNVTEQQADLSREGEQIKAYRDTWSLGIHSYLDYLSYRLRLAHLMLSDTGSLFVQIGEANLHLVRNAIDEVFGSLNLCRLISYVTTSYQDDNLLGNITNYLLWYAKDKDRVVEKSRPIFLSKQLGEPESREYKWLMLPDSSTRPLTADEYLGKTAIPPKSRAWRHGPLTSQGFSEAGSRPVHFRDKTYSCGPNQHWKTNQAGIARLVRSEQMIERSNSISNYLFLDYFPVSPVSNIWSDTKWGFDAGDKVFVVQTNTKIIERCLLMTTDPGDLVLDPTCGSGTTAYVAEQWGRRWITIDTSRVALSIARQRLMTARFENYRTRKPSGGMAENPGTGFNYQTVPHITLKSIAQNTNLDPIFEKHEPVLDAQLEKCNAALSKVTADLHKKLAGKLLTKQQKDGKKAITNADERRWELKTKWEHWEVPFDSDPDWPAELRTAVSAYRTAWRAKMDEVNACIAANADQEELVDKPETAAGVRVSGPFTVEGVMPAELSLSDKVEDETDGAIEGRNTEAYLEQMVRLLKLDGVTYKGNKVRKFIQLEPLWKNGQDLPWHAEGWWDGDDISHKATVGIFLGPQYGPVTARVLEEVMQKAGRTYAELVVAGFSFDPEAVEIIGDQASHPRLMMHQAFIRPDINPGMDGLLKDQPKSQLFTVFGQPDIKVNKIKGDEHTVKLGGVDIYDPLTGSITSTPANKVAAWFLDTDYDGRCFCMTQAFFPDQDAWEKIAKALKSNAEQYAFEALQGTISIPFKPGPNKRVAVKVIDPRGNEVMVVRRLEE